MADENVTASENTTETNEQAATPATQASKPAVPSPAAMKPHAPSPAAFAKKAPQRPATSTGFSEADIKAAEAFGRVADDGTVFVKEGEGEREVGQFPDASKEEALALYARRYLDLTAKLDLFANRLKSSNVKNREIDESIKTLSAEIEQPAVVGDIEALKSQFEALKEPERPRSRAERGPQGRRRQGAGRTYRDCGEGRGSGQFPGRQHQLAFHRGQVPFAVPAVAGSPAQ